MLGPRLRLARKKEGLSMRDLAGRLSPPVSAQAIGKYETGRMMPRSAVLIGLGRALGVSLDFLTAGQVEALAGVEFRKHSGASAKDRARAEAIVIEQLENYLTIEDILEIEPSADPFDVPRCDRVGSFDEVEEKAGALRRHWNLGFDPAPSVTALLEDRGIKVVLADLPARCDGLACGVARGGGRPDTEAVVVSTRTTSSAAGSPWRTSWRTGSSAAPPTRPSGSKRRCTDSRRRFLRPRNICAPWSDRAAGGFPIGS